MFAKIWKKLLLAILIIACLFNIIHKLVKRVSFDREIESSAEYIKTIEEEKEQK